MPEFYVPKDPDAVVDVGLDWTTWLGQTSPADTISTSTWTPDTGLTVDSDENTTTKTKAWLSGGTAGQRYNLVNRIVTANGRTVDRTIAVVCRNR